jgi:hypothetical protein
MFIFGVILGFILGVIVIVARDFRDLKYIIKKQYREIRNTVYTPKNNGNVLTVTPAHIFKTEEEERNKLWYGN